MAFGVKFTPLTAPTAQLPSRRGSLVDVTNASAHFSSEKAIQYIDTVVNDFFHTYSQNCGDNDHSSSMPQVNIVNDDKMDVDSPLEPPEDYDVFPDLAFLESINPQHFDISWAMGDQSGAPGESIEYDLGLTQMAELRALLLETFPEGMPKEIDYESILADQHVPSDPLDPSFWNYFEGSDQITPDEQ